MSILSLIQSDAVNQLAKEMTEITTTVYTGVKWITISAGAIIALIVYIWNETKIRNNKVEDKVERLAEQVTILVTLMQVTMPQTKENTEKINDIQVNCATQNHKKK